MAEQQKMDVDVELGNMGSTPNPLSSTDLRDSTRTSDAVAPATSNVTKEAKRDGDASPNHQRSSSAARRPTGIPTILSHSFLILFPSLSFPLLPVQP